MTHFVSKQLSIFTNIVETELLLYLIGTYKQSGIANLLSLTKKMLKQLEDNELNVSMNNTSDIIIE